MHRGARPKQTGGGMGVIRAEHVAELLRSTDAGTVLVVRGGAAEVVPPDRRDSQGYRGALEVVSRGELDEQAARQDPAALARGFDTAVAAMGG
ncbi:hypothetical protein Tfu_0152 [Thermobifida fusca YX]|nr:hypothetical protein Tfu_0152 [Thermobifida fusca YX]PPS92370.1 hypothetical protein BH05_10365 [Thermobifida fusca]